VIGLVVFFAASNGHISNWPYMENVR
jgi:hypothetical protein